MLSFCYFSENQHCCAVQYNRSRKGANSGRLRQKKRMEQLFQSNSCYDESNKELNANRFLKTCHGLIKLSYAIAPPGLLLYALLLRFPRTETTKIDVSIVWKETHKGTYVQVLKKIPCWKLCFVYQQVLKVLCPNFYLWSMIPAHEK